MVRFAWTRGAFVLAAQAGLWAQVPTPPAAPLAGLVLEGGNADDRAFARAAAGLATGQILDASTWNAALSAVRATDRFRGVEGNLETGSGGLIARIRLEPWPLLRAWAFDDDGAGEAPEPRKLFPELRRGVRAGLARREAWRIQAETLLRASGFPAATITVSEGEAGASLSFAIRRGKAARVQRLVLAGSPEPYGEASLWKLVGAVPGRTLWTLSARREALLRMRKRFLKDHRYEWRADFEFEGDGTLRLTADPGPRVELKAAGASLGFGGITELAPLARAERYGPELLDEGDRRIFRYLRGKGFLDPAVGHRREVVEGSPERPTKVRITYTMQPGPSVVLSTLRFEGNESVSEKELQEVAGLPRGYWGWGAPRANPDLLQGLEDRLKAFYLRRGHSEVRVRRGAPVLAQGQWTETFVIKEGPQHRLEELRLQVPDHAPYDAWAFGEDLLPLLGDRPLRRKNLEPGDGTARVFESDRPETGGLKARIERGEAKDGMVQLSFKPEGPLPYVKGDLILALASMRARLSSLGIQKPKEELEFDEGPAGMRVRLRIPAAASVQVKRLVVQGSDSTRARAILREAELEPGTPYSPERLGQAQARVANLGAFQRVDLEALPEGGEGSLALRLAERNPWVFSHSFGYDRSQGYHVGSGVQRLNVGGMGRSVDFGIRAGDATLNSKALRDLFPTGVSARSVDQYAMGYTDPRFAPAFLDRWIPDRAQYRVEAAYIVERQDYFETHRRRVLNTLDWRIDPYRVVQLGHRFEREDVGLLVTVDPAYLYLFLNTKFPDGRSVISAPFVQFLRDTRNSAFDPIRGTFFSAKLELANQFFGTGTNSSFVKLDLRHQWNWPLGYNAERGVLVAAVRVAAVNPTSAKSENLPISERLFAGGPFSHRGVTPDYLGPRGTVPILDPVTGRPKIGPDGTPVGELIPIGGQGLALINLEYRFPMFGQTFWGEIFLDSGQVYRTLRSSRYTQLVGAPSPFPPFRTALGVGLIMKLGMPIKIEYAVDVKRLLGKKMTSEEKDTQLQGVLVSAGFQF